MSSAEGALSFGTASLLRRTIGGTDENLPEGHQLDSLVRGTYENPAITCPAMVSVLIERLQKYHGESDPNVKLKCLRVIRHCLQRGRQEFSQALRRNATIVKELLTYNCPPDPLRGNAPAKAVRQEAHLCMDALYGGSAANTSSFYKYRRPVEASESNYSIPSLRRMEGFGNTEFRDQKSVVETVAEAIPDSLVTGVTQAVNRVAQYLPAPMATHIETLGNRLPRLRPGYVASNSSSNSSSYRPPQDLPVVVMKSSTKSKATSDPRSPELLAVISLIENTCSPTTSCRPQLSKQTLNGFVRRVNATEVGRSTVVPYLLSKLGCKTYPGTNKRLAVTWQAKVRVINCLFALCESNEDVNSMIKEEIRVIEEIANSGTRAAPSAQELLNLLMGTQPRVMDLLDDLEQPHNDLVEINNTLVKPSRDDLVISTSLLDCLEEPEDHSTGPDPNHRNPKDQVINPPISLLDEDIPEDPKPSPFGFII